MKLYAKIIKKNKKGKLFAFFVVFLIMVLLSPDTSNVNAINYNDFDWDTFYESRKNYWESPCKSDECKSTVLEAQKGFYTKLYNTLAKYQRKKLYISDEIIIQTVFYEIDPSEFADNPEEYINTYYYGVYDKTNSKGAYNIDTDDMDNPNIEIKYDEDAATVEKMVDYYNQEADTVKTLVKNMISYNTTCYGVYGLATEKKLEDGSKIYSCEKGHIETIYGKAKCVDTLQNNDLSFMEYSTSRLSSLFSGVGAVLNSNSNKSKDKYKDECNSMVGYPEDTVYVYSDKERVSLNRYFDYLSSSQYFDRKAHLQDHFKNTILIPAGVDCLTSNICENSLEAKGLYETYEEELIEVRRSIIDDIIDLLQNNGMNISYDALEVSSYIVSSSIVSQRKSFYFPIGSDETEIINGITYATKNPSNTEIVSYFGNRVNVLTGFSEYNYGIDISGVNGVSNVIASYNGQIMAIVDNCVVGDYECNDGYGNMIVISHSNGDYTVYSQLSSIDSNIKIGTSVDRGQVIGKVGMTGKTNRPILHYEIRSGGSSIVYAINPLDNISVSTPRPELTGGDFSAHETSLTKEEFARGLRNYCNNSKNGCTDFYKRIFVDRAEEVYDISIRKKVNPEFVVIRAKIEGMSPASTSGYAFTNNYWGIGCGNTQSIKDCNQYNSFEAGIGGVASVVGSRQTIAEVMSNYAYIGDYWYEIMYYTDSNGKRKVNWGVGGCAYYEYIKKYMSDERAREVAAFCSSPNCTPRNTKNCIKTTSEDQKAYTLYNMRKMSNMRQSAFNL